MLQFLRKPFEYVYLHGPAPLGFWQSLDRADICADLTNVPSGHWQSNMHECHALVARAMDSWIVVAGFSLYMYTLLKIYNAGIEYTCARLQAP